MATRFQTCFKRVLLSEDRGDISATTGTVDTGGLTFYGISAKSHPKAVEEMKKTDKRGRLRIAKEIYREHYWDAADCDTIQKPLDYVVFDCAVNQGLGYAKRFLKACDGDWKKFIELRRERYDELVRKKPSVYKKYHRGWNNRLDEVSEIATKEKPTKKVAPRPITDPVGPARITVQIYQIKKGDTLTKISKKFNTNIWNIIRLNKITDPDKIYVGDILKLPSLS